MVQMPQMESLIPLVRSWRRVLTHSAISSPPKLPTTQRTEKRLKTFHHEGPGCSGRSKHPALTRLAPRPPWAGLAPPGSPWPLRVRPPAPDGALPGPGPLHPRWACWVTLGRSHFDSYVVAHSWCLSWRRTCQRIGNETSGKSINNNLMIICNFPNTFRKKYFFFCLNNVKIF